MRCKCIDQPIAGKNRDQGCADTDYWPRIALRRSQRAAHNIDSGIAQFLDRVAGQRAGVKPGLKIDQRPRQPNPRAGRLDFCRAALLLVARHNALSFTEPCP